MPDHAAATNAANVFNIEDQYIVMKDQDDLKDSEVLGGKQGGRREVEEELENPYLAHAANNQLQSTSTEEQPVEDPLSAKKSEIVVIEQIKQEDYGVEPMGEEDDLSIVKPPDYLQNNYLSNSDDETADQQTLNNEDEAANTRIVKVGSLVLDSDEEECLKNQLQEMQKDIDEEQAKGIKNEGEEARTLQEEDNLEEVQSRTQTVTSGQDMFERQRTRARAFSLFNDGAELLFKRNQIGFVKNKEIKEYKMSQMKQIYGLNPSGKDQQQNQG